jgi:hypothetical protein
MVVINQNNGLINSLTFDGKNFITGQFKYWAKRYASAIALSQAQYRAAIAASSQPFFYWHDRVL